MRFFMKLNFFYRDSPLIRDELHLIVRGKVEFHYTCNTAFNMDQCLSHMSIHGDLQEFER